MHYATRKAVIKTLRTGAFTATASFDLGPGALDAYDALLIHYSITSYSTGNVTIKFSAIPDAARALVCDNAAWTTAALSANAQGTLIIAPPTPANGIVTLTGASTPSMSLAVYVELVSYGR